MSPAALDEPAPPDPGRTKSRLLLFSKTTWAIIVACFALAGSASSLLFTFLPELKPDPRDSVLAQLSVFAIEPHVSLGTYLTLAYGSVSAAPKTLHIPNEELPFEGNMVYVRTRVDGFKHRRVRLLGTLYTVSTQEPVNLPGPLSGPTALRLRTVDLDTPSTSTVQLFWILDLTGEPPTFVRVEMFDGVRMLAVADSPVIRNNLASLPAG
jgi:hypothetical protein